MDLQSRGYEKVVRLMERGVEIPNPLAVLIDDDVDTDRISGSGVVLYPGCRVRGARTVVCSGAVLGAEGPVTLEDCQVGLSVELKGGCFRRSVFLDRVSVGSGAQVREGCLLEEDSSAAHCVGLKQTILFPYVTLGSLINFCDCLMAGGTGRADHSEVGSSYIHFNFTPDGDKATGSLFGDVPRGVMLDQPPIFLGGQGGAVGPIRVGYGTVVAAGSILRHDILEDNKFVFAAPNRSFQRDHRRHVYENVGRTVRNNLVYLANLVALEVWYASVRQPFFRREDMGDLIYEGALDVLSLAKTERLQRLHALAHKVSEDDPAGRQLRERDAEIQALFASASTASGSEFGAGFEAAVPVGASYLEAVKELSPALASTGTEWLQQIVDGLVREADTLLPAFDLLESRRQAAEGHGG